MKIALFGYGKMGKEIEKIALERGHEIILKIKAKEECDFSKVDIAIDFSVPEAALNNIISCFENNIPRAQYFTTHFLYWNDDFNPLHQSTHWFTWRFTISLSNSHAFSKIVYSSIF